MKRMISVKIAGVPSVGSPIQEWRKRSTFKVKGRKPDVPASKEFEAFVAGTTTWIRKRAANGIQESPEISRRDISVRVEDIGEFMLEDATRYEGRVGFDEIELLALTREFASACADADVVILLGGDHAGGMLLYGLPGNVARFDEHSDGCDSPSTCPAGEVARNNYVCAVIRNNLKQPQEIVGVGVREGKSAHPLMTHAHEADILDIDVDVLAEKHGVKTRYSHGTLSPDDLVGAVRRNKPRAIGVFEMEQGDEKAAALVEKLCVEAVIAYSRIRETREEKKDQ